VLDDVPRFICAKYGGLKGLLNDGHILHEKVLPSVVVLWLDSRDTRLKSGPEQTVVI
jgi:hypothetical protein